MCTDYSPIIVLFLLILVTCVVHTTSQGTNTTFTIATFLPQTNKQYLNFKYSVESALEIIAEKYTPVNGVALKLHAEWPDEDLTTDNQTLINEITANLASEPSLLCAIGAYASHSTLALASNITSHLKKPTVSFASTAQSLSPHPGIIRLVASDDAEINAIFDWIFVTEWNDVFVLYSDTVYGASGAETALIEARERGIRVAGMRKIYHPLDDFDAIFRNVKESNAKTLVLIISFSSFEFDTTDFLRHARNHGLLESGINWFFTQTMDHVIKTEFRTDAELRALSYGFYMISQQNKRWSSKSAFYTQLNKHLRGDVPVDSDFIDMLSLYDSYLFDCVMTVYETAVHMIQLGEDPRDGPRFTERMKSYHSIGASGTISFDANGDRLGLITRIVNVGHNGIIHEVASYSMEEGIHNIQHYNSFNHSVAVFSPGMPDLYWKHILRSTPNVNQVRFVSIPLFGKSPSKRFGHCASVVDNEMVIFGGRNALVEGGLSTEYLNDIFVYAFDSALWRYLAPLSKFVPDGRESSQCSMHGRTLYILHGKDQYYILNNFNRFDLDEQTFQQINVFTPPPRYNGGMIRRRDELYAYGGATSSVLTDDIWRYDVLARSDWRLVEPTTPVKPRETEKFAMEYSEYHDAFFIFGGRFDGHNSNNELWKFSFATHAWTKIQTQGTRPGERYACGMVTFDSKVFIGLGWLLKPETIPEIDDIWEIDLQNDTDTQNLPQWKFITTTPEMDKRDSIPMVRWNDQLLIFGGIHIGTRYNDFFSYDILLQQARKVHGNYFTPPPVTSTHAVQIGSKMLLWGGVSFQGNLLSSSQLYVLDLDTMLWDQVTTMTDPPPARHSHTAVAIGDRVFVYGGKDTKDLVFHDLWIMNFNTYTNKVVWIERSGNGPAPSPRAEHSSFFDGRNLYVTHGSFHRPMSDSWSWDIENERWRQHQLRGNAATVLLAHCRAHHMPKFNSAYYIGCTNADGASSVQLYRYKLDTEEFSLFMHQQPFRWVLQYSRPLVVPVRDDSLMVFGGNDDDLVTNELYMINVEKQQIVVAQLDQYLIDARTLTTGTYYNNKLVIFGGTAALPGATKLVKSIILGDTWSINLTPVMSEGLNHTIDEPSAVQCSPGTVEYRGICLPCGHGSYKSTVEHKGTCTKCQPGEYSAVVAANSRLLCLPCAAGTYSSTEGAKECLPCPEGKFCPIASATPLDEPPFPDLLSLPIVIQPTPTDADDKLFINRIVTYSLMSVASSLTVIMTISLVCMWKLRILKMRQLLFFDKFFTTSHHSYYGLMRKKQTVVGAVFSISAFILVLMYFISFTVDYLNGGNIEEVRSLAPNLAQSNTTITVPLLVIQVTAHTYRGQCVKPRLDGRSHPEGIFVPCVNDISVELVGMSHAGSEAPTLLCRYEPAVDNKHVPKCHIQWACKNCRKSFRSQVMILVNEDESYASTVSYEVSTSSGYPGTNSTVRQSVHGNVDSFFRGKQATTVVLSAISTIFNESLTAQRPLRTSISMLEGYHLDFHSVIPGSQVDHQTFHHASGFKVQVVLEETPYILRIERRDKREMVRFITETLAACVGIIGAIRVVMIVCERIVDRLGIQNALSVSEQDSIDEELEFLNLVRGCVSMLRNRKKRKKRVVELQEKLLHDSEFFMLQDMDPDEIGDLGDGKQDGSDRSDKDDRASD